MPVGRGLHVAVAGVRAERRDGAGGDVDPEERVVAVDLRDAQQRLPVRRPGDLAGPRSERRADVAGPAVLEVEEPQRPRGRRARIADRAARDHDQATVRGEPRRVVPRAVAGGEDARRRPGRDDDEVRDPDRIIAPADRGGEPRPVRREVERHPDEPGAGVRGQVRRRGAELCHEQMRLARADVLVPEAHRDVLVEDRLHVLARPQRLLARVVAARVHGRHERHDRAGAVQRQDRVRPRQDAREAVSPERPQAGGIRVPGDGEQQRAAGEIRRPVRRAAGRVERPRHGAAGRLDLDQPGARAAIDGLGDRDDEPRAVGRHPQPGETRPGEDLRVVHYGAWPS